MPRCNSENGRQAMHSTESWEQGGWGTVNSVAWLNVAWSLPLWESLFRPAFMSPLGQHVLHLLKRSVSFGFRSFDLQQLTSPTRAICLGAFPAVNTWHSLGQRGACLLRSQTQKPSPESCKGGHLPLCSGHHTSEVINPLICLPNHLSVYPTDSLKCTWSGDCVLNMGNAILLVSE